MKMRVVSLILVLVIVTVLLASCGTTGETSQPNPFAGRFAVYYINTYHKVIVDKETGVCYFWRDDYNCAGMTVMLNADGSPVMLGEVQHATD